MKKIFILCLAALTAVMCGCNSGESSSQSSTAENVTESVPETTEQTAPATEKVTETQAESETVPKETAPPVTDMPMAEELNLGEVYEWGMDSNTSFVYFTDYGRYYEVEIGGRQSANFVLCLDRGYGEPEILTATEDCSVICREGNSLYLSKYFWGDKENELFRLEDNVMTLIEEDELPFSSRKYFTDEYIYYCERNENDTSVYRMDNDGSNTEVVVSLSDGEYNIGSTVIHDDKVWYDYSGNQGIAYYDLITGETNSFDKGKIGIINNGYMYYTYYQYSDKLFRFNLSTYEYEVVCDAKTLPGFDSSEKLYLNAVNFYDDYILYGLDSEGNGFHGYIYRMNENENTMIFSAKDFFNDEGYYILRIQCEGDRIFIRIGSGAFYQCFIEIDIDGNIIEVIHEDQRWTEPDI